MVRVAATFVRAGGPQRILLPALIGWVATAAIGQPPAPTLAGIGGAAAALALLRFALLPTATENRSVAVRRLAVGIGASFAVIVFLVLRGPWLSGVLFATSAGWIVFCQRYLARRLAVPVEVEALVTDGVLAPLIGSAVAAGSLVAVLPFMALLAPLGAASVASIYTNESLRLHCGIRSFGERAWSTPVTLAVVTLVLVIASTGAPIGLAAERSLLAVSVAAVVIGLAWLMLADPRRDWRERRVRLLVSGAVLAFEMQLFGVLLL